MSWVRVLRVSGIVEGVSFLALLLVAMPLKYAFEQPSAVRVPGIVHGVLFLWFCYVLMRVHLSRQWRLSQSAVLFVAALLPFGFLFVDKRLRREIASAPKAADG